MSTSTILILAVVGFGVYFLMNQSPPSDQSGKVWIGTISDHGTTKNDPPKQTVFTDPPGTLPPAPGHGIYISLVGDSESSDTGSAK